MEFRWNDWNMEHVANHGVSPGEAETVVRGAARPWPQKIEDDKWLVWGRGRGGRLLQVVFALDEDGTVFVLHARPLTEIEKRRFRRRRKG
jgi:uncharacterized DUF497 family protein